MELVIRHIYRTPPVQYSCQDQVLRMSMASKSCSQSCSTENPGDYQPSTSPGVPAAIQTPEPVQQEYDFAEEPPREYFCQVTFELLSDPKQTECCGHLLSGRVVFRLKREGKSCPLCNDPNFKVITDKHFKRKVNELEVRCPHKRNGCEWVGKLGNFDQHSNSCPKRPWQCKYCDFKGTYDVGTTDHLPSCTKYPEPCPNQCEIGTVPRCDMEEHLTQCPLQLVKCEFAQAGCHVRVPRRDLARHMEEWGQRHLLSMSLLNLSLTRDLHQKMTEKDQQIAELQEQLQQQNSKLEKHFKDVEKQTEKMEAQLEDLQQKQAKQITGVHQLKQKLTDQQKETKQQITGVHDQLKQKLTDQRKETKEQITGVHDQLKQKLTDQQKETKEQITGVHDQLKQKLTDQRKETKEQITGVQEKLERKLTDQRKETKEHITGVQMKLEWKLTDQRKETKQQIIGVQEKLEQKLTVQRKETKEQISGLQTQLQNENKKLQQQVGKIQEQSQQILLCGVKGFSYFEFTLTYFSTHKASGLYGTWKSDPFYSHTGGYKFQLNIDTNGYLEARGTHISAHLYLMRGEYDDNLSWPIQITAHLHLLNQRGNKGHVVAHLKLNGVPKGSTGERQFARKFIAHSELGYDAANDTQYLKDDCLYFRLYLKLEKYRFSDGPIIVEVD